MPDQSPFLGSRSPLTRQQLRARRYARVHRDVYVAGELPAALPGRASAAALGLDDAVVSHGTAALLWGLPVHDDGLVHLTRPPCAAVTRREGVRTCRAALTADDRDQVRGIDVTSLSRTFVDLAAQLPWEQLVAVGDVVLRRVGPAVLAEAVARSRRRKGVAVARSALTALDARAASPGETRCRLVLHGAGFHRLQHAVPITDAAGNWLCEADLGDPEARVAVQYDGLLHFQGDVQQRLADLARDELARDAGWQVVVLTAEHLRQPYRAVAAVAAAYARSARTRAA